jgi:hypothetical protein
MAMLYGPLATCPQCRRPSSFGRCIVGQKDLIFRCGVCAYSRTEPLPQIRKKIIYIDQFAISKMVKQRDDPFWAGLHRRLADLANKNLITCPHSPMHVDESLFEVNLRDALKGMYREIAGEDAFKRPPEIAKAQLTRSLKKFLGKPDPAGEDPMWRDWTDRNPHRWLDLFDVHVNFDIFEGHVKQLRAEKQAFWEGMKVQAEACRQQPQTFEEDIEANYASWRTLLLTTNARLTYWLLQCVLHLEGKERNPVEVLNQFFLSEAWKETPFAFLWVRVWAKVAEMVRNPRGSRKPQPGDYYDAPVLAYYAPYCDAMFIDGGYRAIATDPRVDVQGHFGTACFSEQTRGEFIAYLDAIDSGMSQAHRETLAYIYPI